LFELAFARLGKQFLFARIQSGLNRLLGLIDPHTDTGALLGRQTT